MMRQSLIAQGKISKLQTALSQSDTDVSTEILDALRELYRYIQLVEQKVEQVEVQASRPRFY